MGQQVGLKLLHPTLKVRHPPTAARVQVCSFDESMLRLKKAVYKNRIRVKDFLCDFDRLRAGTMHENHFISGLSIAGLDKYLSPQQIGTIVDAYRVQVRRRHASHEQNPVLCTNLA
jgi:hypothetical protein